jgi:ATP-binding cassette subfamily E protein 1
MNRFLASLEITFRRDPTNFRPRVNKMNSVKDREQKGAPCYYVSVLAYLSAASAAGNYFFLED